MNKAALYTFVTSLLDGYMMDATLFGTFLDIAQVRIEGLRPWVKLRAEDSSQSASAATTFTSAKTLPTDWASWYNDSPIVLVDASNNPLYFGEVPLEEKYTYRNASNRFFTDYAAGSFYLCGTLTQSYTIHQYYIKTPTLVSADASNTWVFPTRFHPILGLWVAVFWKHGVDYDVINNAQGDAQAAQANAIYDLMSRWDSNLQANIQRGRDPFGDGNPSSSASGGNINNF